MIQRSISHLMRVTFLVSFAIALTTAFAAVHAGMKPQANDLDGYPICAKISSTTPVKNNLASDHASESRPFQFTGRIRSFQHAIVGILRMVRCQHNAWIHAAATASVIVAGFLLHVSATDWCWVIVA